MKDRPNFQLGNPATHRLFTGTQPTPGGPGGSCAVCSSEDSPSLPFPSDLLLSKGASWVLQVALQISPLGLKWNTVGEFWGVQGLVPTLDVQVLN
jgi:hypothetical protein